MAAYAAVTSLMGTIHQLSQSNLDLLDGQKEHLKLLYEKVGDMQEFLDNTENDEPMKDLQEKIKNLAHEVEDQVESYIQREKRVLTRNQKKKKKKKEKKMLQQDVQLPTNCYTILQQAIIDIHSLKEEFINQWENNSLPAGNCSLGVSSSPRSHVSTIKNNMVGYIIEQERIRGQLIGYSSQLEVISIAGMGGIGKSTFAKRMFSDPSVLSFFDAHGWITVSKDYSLRKMLLSLLQDAIGVKENLDNVSDGDLADCFKKKLKGRRYLIVVDDIWSREAWDDIRLWFPENRNRSRILLTTRDMKVAQYASSPKDPFPMRPLEPQESWNLFCQKAFGKIDCPTEFENVAKEVVENCEGLPLMISVVAGTLSSKRTLDEWKKVAKSMSSLVNLDDYQRCSRVLALSYNHLPSHIQCEISVKKLIRLWVAEGLLELKGLEGLEKLASNLLHDFIEKSLVVVSTRSLAGKIKTCRIHDLLHDLCLREAKSERLLYSDVVDPVSYGTPRFLPEGYRWVSNHSGYISQRIVFDDLTHSKTRSLHFAAFNIWQDSLLRLDPFKLVRVLDLESVNFDYFPSEILHLVGLRYLALDTCEIPEDVPISNLWNLQTLIVSQTYYGLSARPMCLPIGIWGMSQLRHIQCKSMYQHSPRKVSINEVKHPILEKLLSVSGLSPSCCTKELFEGIKKAKKLGISGPDTEFSDMSQWKDNLIYLHELEALNITVSCMDLYDWLGGFFNLPCLSSFPPNLKKLTLCGTRVPWEHMTIISKLPKLEVLQLKDSAFVVDDWLGERWEVTEMGFPELKFLLLEELPLEYWIAADDYFPCLERIIIKNCRKLKEIPEVLADSVTLQQIELWGCSLSLVKFSKKIEETHEDLGNNMLKVDAFYTIRVNEEVKDETDEDDEEDEEGGEDEDEDEDSERRR